MILSSHGLSNTKSKVKVLEYSSVLEFVFSVCEERVQSSKQKKPIWSQVKNVYEFVFLYQNKVSENIFFGMYHQLPDSHPAFARI
jgi:hypothetical protein